MTRFEEETLTADKIEACRKKCLDLLGLLATDAEKKPTEEGQPLSLYKECLDSLSDGYEGGPGGVPIFQPTSPLAIFVRTVGIEHLSAEQLAKALQDKKLGLSSIVKNHRGEGLGYSTQYDEALGAAREYAKQHSPAAVNALAPKSRPMPAETIKEPPTNHNDSDERIRKISINFPNTYIILQNLKISKEALLRLEEQFKLAELELRIKSKIKSNWTLENITESAEVKARMRTDYSPVQALEEALQLQAPLEAKAPPATLPTSAASFDATAYSGRIAALPEDIRDSVFDLLENIQEDKKLADDAARAAACETLLKFATTQPDAFGAALTRKLEAKFFYSAEKQEQRELFAARFNDEPTLALINKYKLGNGEIFSIPSRWEQLQKIASDNKLSGKIQKILGHCKAKTKITFNYLLNAAAGLKAIGQTSDKVIDAMLRDGYFPVELLLTNKNPVELQNLNDFAGPDGDKLGYAVFERAKAADPKLDCRVCYDGGDTYKNKRDLLDQLVAVDSEVTGKWAAQFIGLKKNDEAQAVLKSLKVFAQRPLYTAIKKTSLGLTESLRLMDALSKDTRIDEEKAVELISRCSCGGGQITAEEFLQAAALCADVDALNGGSHEASVATVEKKSDGEKTLAIIRSSDSENIYNGPLDENKVIAAFTRGEPSDKGKKISQTSTAGKTISSVKEKRPGLERATKRQLSPTTVELFRQEVSSTSSRHHTVGSKKTTRRENVEFEFFSLHPLAELARSMATERERKGAAKG